MMPCTSSASRRSDIAVKPDTSANMTETIFRSPSMAVLEVRIFSARCFGVYVTGAAPLRAAAPDGGATTVGVADGAGEVSGVGPLAPIRRVPHSPQNFCAGSLPWPQPAQIRSARAPHSPQNLLLAGTSARHDGQSTTVILLKPGQAASLYTPR